jgi:hypothetical protein
MKVVMHIPNVIRDVLTKWHIQLQHILEVIPFLVPAIIEFH